MCFDMKMYNLILPLLLLLSVNAIGHADIISLTVDPSQSDVDLSINNSMFENSSLSGSGVLDVTSCVDPFGVAQITDLNLTLDDGMSFNLLGILVTATTQPSDVSISMITPGAGGTVSGGTFDQLGNVMELVGSVQIDDPFDLLVGSQTIDLATLGPSTVDFTDIQIARVGDTKTISGTFSIVDEFDAGGGLFIPIEANGRFSASGEVAAVPESGTMIWLGALAVLAGAQSRRI